MLKILYTSSHYKNLIDVEEYLCNCIKTRDIDLWLESQIPEISFVMYDFTHDEVYEYEQYFSCDDEYLSALKIKALLDSYVINRDIIEIYMYIVDEKYEEIEKLYM